MAILAALGRFISAPVCMNVWSSVSRSLCTRAPSSDCCTLRNTSVPILFSARLLQPPPPATITQSAGMKVMGKLRKRCKACYFVMIDERLHIWCDVHPRHKQMEKVPKPKHLLRVCSANQHKIRPW